MNKQTNQREEWEDKFYKTFRYNEYTKMDDDLAESVCEFISDLLTQTNQQAYERAEIYKSAYLRMGMIASTLTDRSNDKEALNIILSIKDKVDELKQALKQKFKQPHKIINRKRQLGIASLE